MANEKKETKKELSLEEKKKKNRKLLLILVAVIVGLFVLCGTCGILIDDTEEAKRPPVEIEEETEEERLEREARAEEERLIAEQKAEEERLEREAREEEERLIAEQKAEEERLIEEKEKAEEEKEFKANAITVTYDELLRHPEKYLAQEIYLKGEIVQSLGSNQYHINMTPTRYGYTDRVWVLWVFDYADGTSLLEKDIIEIWGMGMNNKQYETVLGGSSTIPYVYGYYINLITKAGDR